MRPAISSNDSRGRWQVVSGCRAIPLAAAIDQVAFSQPIQRLHDMLPMGMAFLRDVGAAHGAQSPDDVENVFLKCRQFRNW